MPICTAWNGSRCRLDLSAPAACKSSHGSPTIITAGIKPQSPGYRADVHGEPSGLTLATLPNGRQLADTPWDGSQQQRIRRIGLIAWPHLVSGANGELVIDRLIRYNATGGT